MRTEYGTLTVHRLAWTLAFGPIPDGLFVLHHCDNPPCFRIDHLWLGTAADNMADMAAKGRHARQRQQACRFGHPFDEVNTKYDVNGNRQCRECGRRRRRLPVGATKDVSGPRRTSPGDARPPAPAVTHAAVASPATQAPKVARARALAAWILAGLLIGGLLAVTAERSDGASVRRCPQYEALLAAHGLPVATFTRIMHRESGCQPSAHNRRTHDVGLLQLNRVIWRDQRPWIKALRVRCGAPTQAAAFDPAVNVCLAAGLHARLGMKPWR